MRMVGVSMPDSAQAFSSRRRNSPRPMRLAVPDLRLTTIVSMGGLSLRGLLGPIIAIRAMAPQSLRDDQGATLLMRNQSPSRQRPPVSQGLGHM